MMRKTYFQNLAKAARAGLASYASPQDWHEAIETLAKAERREGESIEAAYARLTHQDADAQRFDTMRRQALAEADLRKARTAGRPRKHTPENVVVTKAESKLFELAKARAQRDHTTFEQGFVAVIDESEGAALYKQTRGQ
jgi:hypothetical protein